MSVIPAMSDRFRDGEVEVTVDTLRDLHRTGPGTMIIADLHQTSYEVTHARDLYTEVPILVPVYGHGDLLHDLDRCQDWEELADATTELAWKQLDRWTESSLYIHPLIRGLRKDMTLQGMDLNHRPRYGHTLDGAKRIDDTFALRADPRITFTACYVQRHSDSLLVSLDMRAQGQHVTTWTQRVTHTEPPRFVSEAPLRAQLHLDTLP
ncbi:hypothetical protein [Nocardiopsis sp. HUAS JQ3]|uniref:hypothetical protein n=1 Tax=Nocardiopsis sp. HUAS JQ3 TaxID=3061629 RepID=UPI0023AA109F|nr:hypothetical protein [Nocardiopsis sp. HUAS JQ3]WDZ90561.1 hypothetical protein PV789_27355 [Nocardiopsis sp. HUAS JQ3]